MSAAAGEVRDDFPYVACIDDALRVLGFTGEDGQPVVAGLDLNPLATTGGDAAAIEHLQRAQVDAHLRKLAPRSGVMQNRKPIDGIGGDTLLGHYFSAGTKHKLTSRKFSSYPIFCLMLSQLHDFLPQTDAGLSPDQKKHNTMRFFAMLAVIDRAVKSDGGKGSTFRKVLKTFIQTRFSSLLVGDIKFGEPSEDDSSNDDTDDAGAASSAAASSAKSKKTPADGKSAAADALENDQTRDYIYHVINVIFANIGDKSIVPPFVDMEGATPMRYRDDFKERLFFDVSRAAGAGNPDSSPTHRSADGSVLGSLSKIPTRANLTLPRLLGRLKNADHSVFAPGGVFDGVTPDQCLVVSTTGRGEFISGKDIAIPAFYLMYGIAQVAVDQYSVAQVSGVDLGIDVQQAITYIDYARFNRDAAWDSAKMHNPLNGNKPFANEGEFHRYLDTLYTIIHELMRYVAKRKAACGGNLRTIVHCKAGKGRSVNFDASLLVKYPADLLTSIRGAGGLEFVDKAGNNIPDATLAGGVIGTIKTKAMEFLQAYNANPDVDHSAAVNELFDLFTSLAEHDSAHSEYQLAKQYAYLTERPARRDADDNQKLQIVLTEIAFLHLRKARPFIDNDADAKLGVVDCVMFSNGLDLRATAAADVGAATSAAGSAAAGGAATTTTSSSSDAGAGSSGRRRRRRTTHGAVGDALDAGAGKSAAVSDNNNDDDAAAAAAATTPSSGAGAGAVAVARAAAMRSADCSDNDDDDDVASSELSSS